MEKQIQKSQNQTLQEYTEPRLIKTDNGYEVSIYSKGSLTKECIAKNAVKIQQAFPELPQDFHRIFADRIKDNRFTDQRLKDAVNHVIDHNIYPKPTIAQFITFDKRIKLYTYDEAIGVSGGDLSNFPVIDKKRKLRAFKPDAEKIGLIKPS